MTSFKPLLPVQTYDSKAFGLGGSQSNRFQPALMAGLDPKAGPETVPGMPLDNGVPDQANGHPQRPGRAGRGSANGFSAAARGTVGSGVNARMGLPPTAVGAPSRTAVGAAGNGSGARGSGPATSGMRSDGGGMRSLNMAGGLPYAIGPQPGASKEGRKSSRSSKPKPAMDQVESVLVIFTLLITTLLRKWHFQSASICLCIALPPFSNVLDTTASHLSQITGHCNQTPDV